MTHLHLTFFVMSGICTNFVHLTKPPNNQKMGAQKHHWGKFFFLTSFKKCANNIYNYFIFVTELKAFLLNLENLVMNTMVCVCLW